MLKMLWEISVGRFRIFGRGGGGGGEGARFRIFGGGGAGGTNSQQAHDIELTSIVLQFLCETGKKSQMYQVEG